MSRNPETETPRRGFFERKDPWGHGLSLWVFAVLAFLIPIALFSLRNLKMENNVTSWLPADDASAIEYNWCRENFPAYDTLYLSWEGSTLDDPRLPVLMGELNGKIDDDGIRRGGIPYVTSVMQAGQILSRMLDMGVEPMESVQRLQGSAVGRGSIKVLLTDAGQAQRDDLIQRIESGAHSKFGLKLRISPAIATWQPGESQQEQFHNQQSRFLQNQQPESVLEAAPVHPHDFQITWQGMGNHREQQQQLITWIQAQTAASGEALIQNCFISPGSPIAVLVTLSEAGVAEPGRAIEEIKSAASRAFIPTKDVVLAGSIISSTELNKSVLRAAWNPQSASIWGRSVFLLSGLVGIAFAFYSLKSWKLGAVVVGAAYYSALLGIALVPITGGQMNMVLVVMPTLLMVLSLSGAIHIANYWKHSCGEHPETAVARAVKMAYQPCLLASATTALGLISLAVSPLAPVRNFGIYAAVGTIISMFMILYGLPSLLQIVPQSRSCASDREARFWERAGQYLCSHWRPTLATSLGLAVICSLGLRYFQIETKVIRYFPEKSQVVHDFKWMEDSLTGTCPVEILVRFDAEAQKSSRFLERLEIVRQVENNIRAHSEVSGALSLADFLPQREQPGSDSSSREKILYNRRSHETEERIKSGEAEGAKELVVMTTNTPHPSSPARSGADELWRINAQCSIVSDADFGQLTTQLNECVSLVIAGKPGVDHFVTGTVPLFLQTQRAVLESLIWSFVMAYVMISVVMIWVLKDAVAGIISMLPNILPVLTVFGLAAWCGQRVDIGTMVTASIALGIAVDGTLHLLTWFQDGLRKGMTRKKAIVTTLGHCGPALWQTSAAVGVGLLVLYPAELLLISRFGWLMASLIGMALLGDIILLPALLMGPLGKLIERRLQRRGEIVPQENTTQEIPAASIPIPSPHFAPSLVPTETSRFAG